LPDYPPGASNVKGNLGLFEVIAVLSELQQKGSVGVIIAVPFLDRSGISFTLPRILPCDIILPVMAKKGVPHGSVE
jgi:hypothetical protein